MAAARRGGVQCHESRPGLPCRGHRSDPFNSVGASIMSSKAPSASRPNPAVLLPVVLALAVSLVSRAAASVTITLDVLDIQEPGPWPPSSIAVVDVLVDISDDDVWTAAGLRVTT